ncbi:TadE family protein [Massilia sp. CMS3.1]|uniref:TadE family protein n=1 Tax=Massilia sp. CMS3.1 TaxID=3373083 RepID=UPI003EE6EBDC
MYRRPRLFRRAANGSVAVEMAIILPLFILVLVVPFFLARLFWFYSVGQKAAHDATRFLSTATQAEMRTPGGGFNEARVAAIARWIAQEELQEILPFTEGILIDVQCNTSACGANVPEVVRVGVQISLHDNFFGSITSSYLGNTDMVLVGDVTMRYVGDR